MTYKKNKTTEWTNRGIREIKGGLQIELLFYGKKMWCTKKISQRREKIYKRVTFGKRELDGRHWDNLKSDER